MLFDGIRLTEGSELSNLVVASGPGYPPEPDTGELFYATGAGTPDAGLYVYTGSAWIRTDNTLSSGDVLSALGFTPVDVAGSTMTGLLTLSGAPSANLHAATKAYVDGAANQTITLSGDATGSGTSGILVSLVNSGVSASSYGSATQVGTFTVDVKGRLTAAANTPIAIATSAVTSGTFTDARIAASNVTQHQAGLTISETQITDGALLARVGANETISGSWTFSGTASGIAPVSAAHFATKDYVDTITTGLAFKASARAASTANITLSGLQTIDGVVLAANERVLVKNQSTASQNGIYLAQSGAWTRSADFDGTPVSETESGAYVFIREGTINASSGWVLATANPITIDTTPLSFTQFTGLAQISAGTGLVASGSVINAVGTAGRIVANADSLDLDTVGTAGTYKSVTTDAYGRVTAGTNPTTLAGFGITDAAPISHVGTGDTAHANVVAAGAAGFMTGADKTKLDGVATSATANSSDATLLARANHTGTQAFSTLTGLPATLAGHGITDAVLKTGDTMTGALILNANPSVALGAATKQYVDSQVSAASGLPITIVSGTSQTAVANNHYVITNTASATTVTLPASPAAGAIVWVMNSTSRSDHVIARNGQLIAGINEDVVIDLSNVNIQLRFIDNTIGWRIL